MQLPNNTRLIKDVNLPSGGTYDILFTDFVEGYPESKIVFALASTAEGSALEGVSRRVAGVQKLVQQFLKVLLTKIGTDPLRPDRGTNFSEVISQGNLHSKGETEGMIRSDIASASEQMASLTSSRESAYEQFQSAELTGLSVGVNAISISVQITSVAGEGASIFTPFPRLDMNINV